MKFNFEIKKYENFIPKKDFGKGNLVCNFAERNFNIGDRVRLWYNKKWYTGTVEQKIKKENSAPNVISRMDELVSNSSDALLEGYGLSGKPNNLRSFFEDEPFGEHPANSGAPIYRIIAHRKQTEEEKKNSRREEYRRRKAIKQDMEYFTMENKYLLKFINARSDKK